MRSYRVIDKHYLQDDEERLIRHILPARYVRHNLSEIDADYALKFLQNELNELLHSFVNGGFSYKGYLLFPLVKGISKNNLHRINGLKEIASFLNEKGHDFSGSINSYGNLGNSVNFAKILSSLYDDLSHAKSKSPKSIKKPKCPEFNIDDYKKADLEYLRPLLELKEYAGVNLRKHLAGFYLHGSFATRDYVKGWSDVDTLAIVSKETISNPKKLLELRKKMYYMRHFLYKIDPLQHHGSIVISEYDLQNYCRAYFPVEIFRYSRSFFKDSITSISARDHSQEALSRLFWLVSYFRGLKHKESRNMGAYELKNLLHSITLFPSIYLNAKNIFVYKKFSFGIARKDFTQKEWKVIDDAGAIRANWREFGRLPLVALGSKINPLLAYQLNSKIMSLFNKMDIDSKYLVEGMFNLSEEAWRKIKNARGV